MGFPEKRYLIDLGYCNVRMRAIRINVKLYGHLKIYAPGDKNQFEMIIDPGTTLEDFFKLFAISDDRCVSLINGRRANKKARFKEKDTLVLFPQICGG